MYDVQIAAIVAVFKACASALRKMAAINVLNGKAAMLIEAAAMVEAAAAKLEGEDASSH